MGQIFRRGSRGEVVKKIQEILNDSVSGLTPKLEEDGVFGPKTEAAVRLFQAQHKVDGKSLKVDGIVGKNTLKALSVVNYTLIQQAARTLSNPDLTVGQKSSNGCDCGYFSAYLLHKFRASNGNLAGLSMNYDDVLRQRDLYGDIPAKYHGKEQTGSDGKYLRITWAPGYLEKLGSPGFRVVNPPANVGSMAHKVFIKELSQMVGHGTIGAMMAAPNFGSRAGHWIVLLKTKQVGQLYFVLVYDSSGSISKTLRQKQLPAGNYLAWVDSRNLQGSLPTWLLGLERGFVRK